MVNTGFLTYILGANHKIESFHKDLKHEIKGIKRALTKSRSIFIRKFLFYFNNRQDFFNNVVG